MISNITCFELTIHWICVFYASIWKQTFVCFYHYTLTSIQIILLQIAFQFKNISSHQMNIVHCKVLSGCPLCVTKYFCQNKIFLTKHCGAAVVCTIQPGAGLLVIFITNKIAAEAYVSLSYYHRINPGSWMILHCFW